MKSKTSKSKKTSTKSKKVKPEKVVHKPRNKEQFPALNFKRQVKIRQEYLDIDYVDKLSPEEKAWLNSFVEETVITNFKHKGKKLIKSQSKKRELWRENNHRNMDVYGNAKAGGTLRHSNNALSDYLDSELEALSPEDQMIERIDAERSRNGHEED